MTAVANGTATVKATSTSDELKFKTNVITISYQAVLVTSITVTEFEDAVIIDVLEGMSQMIALVLPENAPNKSYIWSVEDGTGLKTISLSGLLTAVANGIVIVKATATNDPLMFGT